MHKLFKSYEDVKSDLLDLARWGFHGEGLSSTGLPRLVFSAETVKVKVGVDQFVV